MPSSVDHEHEPRVVDEYVAIDMDRTLLKTNDLVELLCMLMVQHGSTQEEMENKNTYIRSKTGQGFQLIEHLRSQYPNKIDVVLEEALAFAEDGALSDLVYEGTSELFNELEKKKTSFGILTYGNEEDQQFKLSLLRKIVGRDTRSLPALVTDVKKKAVAITKWPKDAETGNFVIPDKFGHDTPIHTKRVIILDDYKHNLISSDSEHVLGILVNNGDEKRSLHSIAMAVQDADSISQIVPRYESL